jgi:glycosyltransferase involved in cell wall biosynthesis
MRILHVLEVSSGGVTSVVSVFSRSQDAAGHDVHILAPPSAVMPGARGTRHDWRPHRRSPHRFPAAVRDLQSLISELRPDVVHLHSFFAGLLGRLLPLSPNPAVIYQPHSWAFRAVPNGWGSSLVALWERFASRRTTLLVVNCRDELEEGIARGVELPFQSVGVPVDTERFTTPDPEARTVLRKKLGVHDRRVVACVGRLSRQKGQDRLVAAWRRNPIPGAALVLVGAGDVAPLAKLAGNAWGRSVYAVGPVEDVREWLWAADVCAMPSRYEGQSVAMAEALACGLPVVASPVNGALEAIVEGPEHHAGAVVDSDDMMAFMGACRRLLDDDMNLAQESDAARLRAQRMFNVDEVMQRVNTGYSAALNDVFRRSGVGHQ